MEKGKKKTKEHGPMFLTSSRWDTVKIIGLRHESI